MANLSNSSTSSSKTQSIKTNALNAPLFKVGDRVLCPSLGLGLDRFTLHKSEYKGLLEIHAHNSIFLYDKDGFFVRADLAEKGDPNTLEFATGLFQDTPANRQAIATLYQCKSNIKIIDITEPDDDEVVKVPSVLLSDMACDAVTALESFNDIASMLYMFINDDKASHQVKALARLAYETAFNRADTQLDIVNKLNKPLTQSKFGTVEVSP